MATLDMCQNFHKAMQNVRNVTFECVKHMMINKPFKEKEGITTLLFSFVPHFGCIKHMLPYVSSKNIAKSMVYLHLTDTIIKMKSIGIKMT
jgi:hypothetical protein